MHFVMLYVHNSHPAHLCECQYGTLIFNKAHARLWQKYSLTKRDRNTATLELIALVLV
jgi:hypothetical protein